MEQPNQQDNLPMEDRTTHKINHMDQHSPESIPSKMREKSKHFEQ
jgi:hypothetical protein